MSLRTPAFVEAESYLLAVADWLPGVARRQVPFFCVAKRKEPKKRRPRFAAPAGYPALLVWSGGCGTRPSGAHKSRPTAELRQSSPTPPDQPPLLGGAQGRGRSSIGQWKSQNCIYFSAGRVRFHSATAALAALLRGKTLAVLRTMVHGMHPTLACCIRRSRIFWKILWRILWPQKRQSRISSGHADDISAKKQLSADYTDLHRLEYPTETQTIN